MENEVFGLTKEIIIGIIVTFAVTIILIFYKKIKQAYKNYVTVTPFLKRTDLFKKPRHSDGMERVDLDACTYEEDPLFGVFSLPSSIEVNVPNIKPVKTKLPKKQRLTKSFFDYAICDFDYIIHSNSLVISPGSREDNYKFSGKKPIDIVKNLFIPALSKPDPQIVCIHGKVGCGKTTLIGSLMNELGKINAKGDQSVNYFPIYIDTREEFKTILDEIINDDSLSGLDIENMLRQKLLSSIISIMRKNGLTYTGDKNDAISLFRYLQIRNLHVVLFLDELDIIYYDFSRSTFDGMRNQRTQVLINKYRKIIKYFVGFTDDELVSGVYSNVLFVIALRTSSFRLIKEVYTDNLTGGDLFASVQHDIRLNMLSNKSVKNMISKRLEYKRQHVLDNKDNIPDSHIIVDNIDKAISNVALDVIDYAKNLAVSIHGMRHIMTLLKKAEISDPSCGLLSNLISHPGLLKTFQYLDGCCDFSISREGISNIFLVNRDYEINWIRSHPNSGLKNDSPLLNDHLHTYTMKYLLFHYISERSKSGETISLESIYSRFCNSASDFSCFERDIVDLALLHSTEVNHGRLMKLEYSHVNNNVLVKPSSRAVVLFDKNMFWQFGYLMVIVEDNWLEYPKSISNIFDIQYDWQRAYHFFTKLNVMSDDEKLRYLKYKTMVVLVFCQLLKVAFRREKERYESVYELYCREMGLGKKGIDIDDKVAVVKESIINFTKKYISEELSKTLSSEIKRIENRELAKITAKVNRTYDEYHSTSALPSVLKKMEYYYKHREFVDN